MHRCGHVKQTLVPEPFKIWKKSTENHDLIGRPVCVLVNSRGEPLVLVGQRHIACMFTRHNPPKLACVAGEVDQKGTPTRGRLDSPLQATLLVVKKGKDERAIITDACGS